jgi:hypothetical protein
MSSVSGSCCDLLTHPVEGILVVGFYALVGGLRVATGPPTRPFHTPSVSIPLLVGLGVTTHDHDTLTALQALPRDAELLAFEAGREDYCEREVGEVEWQGDQVYLHLGARRGDPPRR